MDLSIALSILANLLIAFLIFILNDLKSDFRSIRDSFTKHLCDYQIHRIPEGEKK